MLRRFQKNIQFIREHDPAAKSDLEVLLCYPGFHALYLHKLAHRLYQCRCFLLSRCLSQISRFFTGIEIHPAAQLADQIFIDHGMGVVIGETSIVEERVVIYQGVTLGGVAYAPVKRHPTIRSGVIIGAHAQILGDIEIGANSKVGAGALILKSVPVQSTVVGTPGNQKTILPAKLPQ